MESVTSYSLVTVGIVPSHAHRSPDFPSLLQRFLNLFSVPNPLMSKRLFRAAGELLIAKFNSVGVRKLKIPYLET